MAELFAGAGIQRVPEGHAARELVAGYLAPDVAQHEIDEQVFRELQQVAHAGRDDVLDVGIADDLLEDVREVLKDNDAAGAGIRKLVFEFTGRVQGIHVDDDEPGTERTAHGDRVLEHVGQHDGDPLAARQLQVLLQVARELHRQFVEIAVGERRSHVGVSRVVRVLLETVFDHLANGAKRGRRHLLGHTGRIGLQPDFFHAWIFLVRLLILLCSGGHPE